MAVTGLSPLRLTGLASGMDTDGIITSLLKIEQLKVDRELRNKQTLLWKKEAYSDMSSAVSSFANNFLSVLGKDNIVSSAAYNTTKVTALGGSAGAVSVSGSIYAQSGTTMSIDKITQLAVGKNTASAGKVSNNANKPIDVSTKLGDLDLKKSLFNGGTEIAFKINGKEFRFNKNTTLGTMISTVNADSDANVTMSYSQVTDTFKIESKTIGAGSELTIQNLSGNAFAATAADSAFGISTDSSGYNASQMAQLTVNGVDIERDSNSFAIDGINIKLNKATETGAEPITLAVERDVQPAIDKIKSFVDAYNTLVEKLTTSVNERKTADERAYTPLTDEEKSAMSETEIAIWETTAKKGLLGRDTAIQKVLSDMRTALYSAVEGAGLSPSSIGLKTSTYASGKSGQIELDEAKLKSALEANPERVMSIFTASSDSAVSSVKFAQSGLADRLKTAFAKYNLTTAGTTLVSLQGSIDTVTARITLLEKRMSDKSEALYQKYAKMEEALSKLNDQSSWLAGLTGQTQSS